MSIIVFPVLVAVQFLVVVILVEALHDRRDDESQSNLATYGDKLIEQSKESKFSFVKAIPFKVYRKVAKWIYSRPDAIVSWITKGN